MSHQPEPYEVLDPCDVVVLGSGAAGLSAALGIAEGPRAPKVLVVTKGAFGASGSSPWAQGGIAGALGDDDAPAIHAADTERVGAGLNDRAAVRELTARGPAEIERLRAWGARFDREPNRDPGAGTRLALGREAGHRRRRIVHAGGDRTGAEVMRILASRVVDHPGISVLEHFFAADLLTAKPLNSKLASKLGEPPQVTGVWGVDESGAALAIPARAVVLATGGLGQLYRYTTVPAEVTGDGIAMAARAGARMADLEFVQFHPTALGSSSDSESGERSLPLLTEALRGDGAHLVDRHGHRFMTTVHPDAELAPRDVVARALYSRGLAGEPSFLDLRPVIAGFARGFEDFAVRFPNAVAACAAAGIDPSAEPVPVTPAAHYTMGGVAVDLDGRTSLPGLWACGEVSASGAHGANRLASNSLLEALVFGRRIADQLDLGVESVAELRSLASAAATRAELRLSRDTACPESATVDVAGLCWALRDVMWRRAGLVRDERGLRSALVELREIAERLPAGPSELRNLVLCGRMVVSAALRRSESRGAHYRSDAPRSSASWRRRQSFLLADLDRDDWLVRDRWLSDSLDSEPPRWSEPSQVAPSFVPGSVGTGRAVGAGS